MENKIVFNSDCRYFKGDLPCKPHKDFSYVCSECKLYEKITSKILIIKFGAIGDVIRTTPLITKIKKEFPNSEIWWITQYPDVLPKSKIDRVLTLTIENLLILEETEFDMLYSLDKDSYATALANKINAKRKFGFCLKDGKPAPLNELATHKYLTGLFDDINQANMKSYLEEVFEIVGFEFSGEEYLLDIDESLKWDLPKDKKIIGLNTGCGDRWVSRLWSNEKWIELINLLQRAGYYPLLLGGRQEDEKNKLLSEQTNAAYLGHFPLNQFISLINQCDAVVSAVTMAMHLTIGLKKNLILLNNIFNKYEFELYNRGEIIEPEKKCTCFFSPKCKNKEYFCMDHISASFVFEAVRKWVHL